jgi:sugar lactone lactonase YvrE
VNVDWAVEKESASRPAGDQKLPAVRVFSGIHCRLGEGPAWDQNSKTLFWADIQGRTVFAATAGGGGSRSWKFPEHPSAVIIGSDGDLLVPAGRSIFRLCTESGDLRLVAQLAGEPQGNRCNDAKCDPNGNLWVGTMDNNERNKSGRLWRFSSGGAGSVVLEGVGIANTLAWDLARGRFYFADSMVGDIYVFDYDSESAEISHREVFFPRSHAAGVPDGSAIDDEGYLWNARWDGSCVIRISPDGELDRVIELPTMRPTSCAFGGLNMKTLFVTSAAAESLAPCDRVDNAGSVFSVEVDVAGAVIPPYGGLLENVDDTQSDH